MPDGIDQPGWTEDANDLLPAKQHSEELVEADEVVHVPVGDEHVADTEELARRQRREVAEIEHQGAWLRIRGRRKGPVAERIVDKLRIEVPRHDSLRQLDELGRRFGPSVTGLSEARPHWLLLRGATHQVRRSVWLAVVYAAGATLVVFWDCSLEVCDHADAHIPSILRWRHDTRRLHLRGPRHLATLGLARPAPGHQSLVLIIDDPDAPDPKAPKLTWVHWVVYNLPPQAAALVEDAAARGLPKGSETGLNDWKRANYGGPCPPIGRHRYFHKLYALDAVLVGLHRPTKAQVETAMQGHVLAEACLIGTYQKGR